MRPQDAVRRGCDRRTSHHGSRGNFPCIHRDSCPRNRLSAPEGLLRNRGDRAGNVLVHVRDVVDSGVVVDDGGVVDIRDGGCVNSRITDIDAIDVSTAHSVRRHVYFTRA